MELREANNKQLLQELQTRIQSNQLNEQQITKILKVEAWKKAFRLMNEDTERNQEIAEWDKITSKDC